MYSVLFMLLLPAAPPEVPADAETEQAQPRSFQAINEDIRRLFKAEATTRDRAKKAAAVHEMTYLYREILRDPRFETSETLQQYKARIWSRMMKVKRDIENEQARNKRRSKSDDVQQSDQVNEQLAVHVTSALAVMGASQGGPLGLVSHEAHARGGRALPPDYGPALVSLIERTIAPDFWDVHGGPGTIVYYRPLRVLVVRATGDVHERIGGVTGALRGASK